MENIYPMFTLQRLMDENRVNWTIHNVKALSNGMWHKPINCGIGIAT